jgi:hypothetical protein
MLEAEQLGCLDPAVSCYDLPIIIDQDRIGEDKALDAVGDLAKLLPRMRARVSRARGQFINWTFDYGARRALQCMHDLAP